MSIMDIAGAASISIPEESPITGFAGDADAEASDASGADRSMTEPEEHGAGWRMDTGFAGDTDAIASATSGADRSMTEPEEHGAGWPILTAFASDAADATSCAASGSDRLWNFLLPYKY